MAARLTSKEELNIIDDKLLVDGIYGVIQHNPDVPARSDANLVDLAPKANFLCLSFRLIGKIENIVGFSALTKLCLDNNRIKDIVNLETLTNLRWLDLSFNRIHKIQGLKALTRLEDLSLYNNKITIIEGLEHCSSLQCLSLGNNRVDSLDQVVRLRQLRSLRMLTLAGNPICREVEYKMTVLAYVDTLRYLDYALVDASEFNTAQEQYHDELLDVQEKESVVAEKISRDKQLSDYLKQLEDAGNVFAHVLFDDMFTEDADLEKLKHLPGIKELVESFRVTFKQLSEEYIRVAMEKHEKKNAESQCFERSIKTIRTAADQESIVIVENFNKLKKDSLHQIYDRPDKSSVIDALQAELETVVDALMGIEVRQVEKFDALVDDFDNRTNELKNGSLEMQQTFFRAVSVHSDTRAIHCLFTECMCTDGLRSRSWKTNFRTACAR